jgi:hypothetical protein
MSNNMMFQNYARIGKKKGPNAKQMDKKNKDIVN